VFQYNRSPTRRRRLTPLPILFLCTQFADEAELFRAGREECCKLAFMVGCNVVVCVVKRKKSGSCMETNFPEQGTVEAENIPVGESMRRVVASHALQPVLDDGQQDHPEIGHSPADGDSFHEHETGFGKPLLPFS